MKRYLFLLMVIPLTLSLHSQRVKPVLSFESTIHNFGEIAEEDGPVGHVFHFSNTGGQPLVIHNVRTSCRCTAPEWTRTPIQPGGKGTIVIAYNPKNRPGNFNQSITIVSNAEPANTILRVIGSVNSSREVSVNVKYPRQMDVIRLKSTYLSFGKVKAGTLNETELGIINVSDNPVVLIFDRVPEHLLIESVPSTLNPGQEGIIKAKFDASKIEEWGLISYQVPVTMNGSSNRTHRLRINATIEENFSNWSEEELANAPEISFSQTSFNFNEVEQGQIVEHVFNISNTGKSNLIIRRVRTSCGCTASQPQRTIIPPGETTSLPVSFNTRGRNGRQNQAITIYSNDPKNSKALLRLSGSVTQ